MFHEGFPVLRIEVQDIHDGREQALEVEAASLVRGEPRLVSRESLWDQAFAVYLQHLGRRLSGYILVANIEKRRLHLPFILVARSIEFLD